ncbi:MAG TPA: hypothetical protein V6D43_24320 [Candidatus Sericytochromatia bacterium]|jgi:hypothetical protein
MHPPATVNWKLLKIASLVVGTSAFLSLEIPQTRLQAQPNQSISAVPKADGLYLYGETPQPNQLTKAYVVFQRQKGKVVGAIYSPNSEFSCFTGSQTNNTLDVKSVETGELHKRTAKINLSSLHQIKALSATEQRIISACKQAAPES